LIPHAQEVVQANGNKINLCFAADGRKTSNKIRTVMAVFSILEENNHGCDYQYTIALYNGKDRNDPLNLQANSKKEFQAFKYDLIENNRWHFKIHFKVC